jgi:hypothetical protein
VRNVGWADGGGTPNAPHPNRRALAVPGNIPLISPAIGGCDGLPRLPACQLVGPSTGLVGEVLQAMHDQRLGRLDVVARSAILAPDSSSRDAQAVAPGVFMAAEKVTPATSRHSLSARSRLAPTGRPTGGALRRPGQDRPTGRVSSFARKPGCPGGQDHMWIDIDCHAPLFSPLSTPASRVSKTLLE